MSTNSHPPEISSEQPSLRAGLVGFGLDTYWSQFDNLKSRLLGYQARIAERLSASSVEVVDLGLVDNDEAARQAGARLQSAGVEVVFLYLSTYALSSTILPVVQRLRAPVIVLALQPVPQLDYEAFNRLDDRGKMTGIWLEHCQSCSAPEIACVFNRADIPFHLITGYLQDEEAWQEIAGWIEAARAAAGLRTSRVGIIGHYYSGMLDVYSDLTQQSATFGTVFKILEMDEVNELRESVDRPQIENKLEEFRRHFKVSDDCEVAELERAARTSCALDGLVSRHQLGAIAYYHEGQDGTPLRDIATSVIAGFTLLTGRHVPVAGECEVKNVLAMKILDLLNAGGSFSEFYLIDFKEDVVFWGHDGPAHFRIAEGVVGLVPLPVYHGKPGKGLSIQMTVAAGPVTLLSILQHRDGTVSLLAAEGEAVPGPVLQIGNTNSRYRFSIGAKAFVNAWSKAGPSHHCAIGAGHVAGRLEKLACILGIRFQRVC